MSNEARSRNAALRVADALQDFGRREPRVTGTPAWGALLSQIATALAPTAPEAPAQRSDLIDETAMAHAKKWREWEQGSGDDAKDAALVAWVVERWKSEVSNRPLVNVHRRSLDDTWRQMLRHLGADDVALLGPTHDTLAAIKGEPT